MNESRPIIVLSRQLPPLFTQALQGFAEVRVGGTDAGADILDGASVYLAAGVDAVPAELIGRFPGTLGLIANIATGTDNIDLAAATARGIAVSNTPVVTEDTADLTFALPIARFAVETSELDYREVYGRGIEEDAYQAYMDRSREKLDAFDAGYTFTAQMIDEIILPGDVRRKIVEALDISRGKVEELPERSKIHGAPPT